MKLEDQLRDTMRFKHLSFKTEESYVGWSRRYLLWHGKKHPSEMGAVEVEAFLIHLAEERKPAASSQNQALNALVFLYREVLKVDLEGVDAQRAKHTKRLPILLTQAEVAEHRARIEQIHKRDRRDIRM
jgi:site-specific recombinase XerD